MKKHRGSRLSIAHLRQAAGEGASWFSQLESNRFTKFTLSFWEEEE